MITWESGDFSLYYVIFYEGGDEDNNAMFLTSRENEEHLNRPQVNTKYWAETMLENLPGRLTVVTVAVAAKAR